MKRMQQTTTTRHDSIAERLRRFRGFIILVSVPLLLISFVLLFMPRIPNSITLIDDLSRNSSSNSARKSLPSSSSSSSRGSKSKSYAVIFDAGSSGSRVHVYCFDGNLDLVPIGDDLELFVQKKPGLSSFAENPKEAANSLKSLLEKAESVIPKSLLKITPVRVGATAGLRALPGDTSQKILQAVHEFLVDQSSLKSAPNSVTILDGTQEGSFQWVTINYLLGNLGKDYSDTVGVVDLGGGSVQMAYAISEKDAKTSPRLSDGQDTYIRELFLKGTKYYLYVHSYLNYGLLAARAEILKAFESHSHPCVLQGFEGTYHYGGSQYKVAAMPSGSSYKECRAAAIEALKVNDTCTYLKCTFGGTWNGGGGDGQVNLFVASFFFDRAVEAGFIDDKNPIVKVRPVDFENAAKRACGTTFLDAKALYVNVEENNLPYFCMDLVYQYTLLVDGFALDPQQQITLVKKVKYKGLLVEAAWPLGSAIEVASAA